ncbi:DNA-processing protein DprA [Janibacter sp. Y6]|uniref:DNA-processing protein DprA n=1 Tax=Janibacter sp. Y6 TaxID=2913552 RepID=UPI0034A400DC
MSAPLRAPGPGEQRVAHDMVGTDERRARLAWAAVLEIGQERASHDPPALCRSIREHGHVGAWHRLVAGELRGADGARARVLQTDVDAELSRVERVGARVVVPGDDEWPDGLADERVEPHVLYLRGTGHLRHVADRAVGVVGSRASTGYGEAVARDLGAGLSSRGWGVVSGAAFGIDAAAHLGALAVGGPGVAVLACGPDQVYPQAHRRLVDEIAQTGVVVTEQPVGRVARRHRFLTRNRLIAALSRCVVVVEAGPRSGSLNTAGWAEALGRPVGAVPGPVTSMASAGCHERISRGEAHLVTDAEDVLRLAAPIGDPDLLAREDVGALGPARDADVLTQHQRQVYDVLAPRRESSVGHIATELALPVTEVLTQLASLQLEGFAAQGESGWVRRHPAGSPHR